MSKLTENIVRVIIIIAIVGGGLFIKKALSKKQEVRKEKGEGVVYSVATTKPERVKEAFKISTSGSVVQSESVSLIPEVPGKIIWVREGFTTGSRLKKGDLIARIDDRDLKAKRDSQVAQVEAAKLEIEVEENRQKLAAKEKTLLGDSVGPLNTLQSREPQLKAAKLKLKAAQAALVMTDVQLSRTRLSAPFDALVVSENIDLGQVVGGAPVAQLMGTRSVQVRASIPSNLVQSVKTQSTTIQSQVIQKVEGVEHAWDATFLLLEGSLDAQLKNSTARLRVEAPFDSPDKPSLSPGSSVEVRLNVGTPVEWTRLPLLAKKENSIIWYIDSQSRAQAKSINISFENSSGLYSADQLDPDLSIITDAPKALQVGAKVKSTEGASQSKRSTQKDQAVQNRVKS